VDKIRPTKPTIKRFVCKSFTRNQLWLLILVGKTALFCFIYVLALLTEIQSNPLVVVYADTLVENPVIHNHAMRFLDKVKNYCDVVGIDARIMIARPDIKNTYWVNVIGKGYPLPSFRFRWCQDKLKIKPMKKLLSSFEDGFILVAVRMDESTARKRSLSKRLNTIELERNHLRVFAPIYDFTEDDVWSF